jgi:prepilin-type N-terminal cleavage/methylation domain-containing protein
MTRCVLLKNQGYSLSEMVITLGIVSIVSLLISYPIMMYSNMNAGSDSVSTIAGVRAKYWRVLQDDQAWAAMKANYVADGNPSLACVAAHTDCSALVGTPSKLFVFDSNNVQVFPGGGFDRYGHGCTTFSNVTPTDSCPFLLKVTWQPRCSNVAGACIDPEILIKMNFSYSPATRNVSVGNISRYNFNFYRTPSSVVSGAQACAASGGTWNAATSVCTPPAIPPARVCAAGFGMTGFDAAGNPVCSPLPFNTLLQCGADPTKPYLIGFSTDPVSGNLVPTCGPCL